MKTYPYEIENFIKIYERSFIDNWDLPALSEYTTKRTITYGELAKTIAEAHLIFETLGLQQGSRIAVCGKDSMNWVVAYMATVTYGAVIVPILADFNPVDITHIINHSEAELLFISENVWEHIEPEALLSVKGVVSLEDNDILYERDNDALRDSEAYARAFPEPLSPWLPTG